MPSEKSRFSFGRVIFFAGVLLTSGVGAYYFGDDFMRAEKPSEYIAVIFSILAASLFVVISILGDPSMIVSGPTRTAWVNAKEIQKELHFFVLLFIWYLLTLGMMVAAELVESSKYCNFYWISNIYVFLPYLGLCFH